ncbi:MAG: Ni/Fe-hydrogenase, b-type cytochrome subunit [Bernardetiaceae bacterium]
MKRKIISGPVNLRRVYVWELPVRIYHWLNALCMLILIVTGFIIANPVAILSGKEASDIFLFGTVRYVHFATAYVAFFNFLFRIYWGFVGNKYARWDKFIPTNLRFFRELWDVIKMDIFMIKNDGLHAIGHNKMAGLVYFGLFLAFVVQCLTGFGLYAGTSDFWFPQLFTWVPALMGGDFMIRQIHHWAMYFFIFFTMVHIYLSFYHDYIEGRGIISSMAGGWKFIEEEKFAEDQAHEKTHEKAQP